MTNAYDLARRSGMAHYRARLLSISLDSTQGRNRCSIETCIRVQNEPNDLAKMENPRQPDDEPLKTVDSLAEVRTTAVWSRRTLQAHLRETPQLPLETVIKILRALSKTLNIPRYHLHFGSDDRTKGGMFSGAGVPICISSCSGAATFALPCPRLRIS